MTFPLLKTQRLLLRRVTEDDSKDVFNYMSDHEVMKYYGLAPFETENDALDEIKWYESIYNLQTGIRWGITLLGQDKVIGSCGFLNWDKRHNRVEIGFELSRAHWGQGIMTEAVSAAIDYGFNYYSFNRIQALVEPMNTASTNMLKKLGFYQEGILYEYEFTCGKYDDLIMLSLLKRKKFK